MRRCIIHFGLHKTGTTSIQQALFSDSSNCKFVFINFGTPFIGRNLLKGFCQPPWRFAPDLQRTSRLQVDNARMMLGAALNTAEEKALVISAEALSLLTEEELKYFINFLLYKNLKLEACAYVRDFESWCESIFQQSSRYGTWKPSLFPMGIGAYRFAIEKFDRLLGIENVSLWKYDRKLFPEGCVVRDFYRRCGFGEYHGHSPRLNEGLSLNAAKLLQAYHRSGLGEVFDETSFQKNIQLASYIQNLHGPQVRFHKDLISERMMIDSEDLDWIENRLGHTLREGRPIENPAYSIRSEEDLNKFSDEELDWLRSKSGCHIATQDSPAEMSHTVACAMATLRERLSTQDVAFKKISHWPNSTPKVIWMFWSQGASSTPPLVDKCIDSWHQKNPGWEVRLLDEKSAEPYMQKANVPPERFSALPSAKRANLLRMRLLTEEGGVWADATTFCLRPLNEWLPECMDAGFFCFRNPGSDRLVANWFLASVPQNLIACLWRDTHEEFWARKDYIHHRSYDGKGASDLPITQRLLLRFLHFALNRNTHSTDLWFHPLAKLCLRTYPYCVMHYIYSRGRRQNSEWMRLDHAMPYRDAKPLLMAYGMVPEGRGFQEIIDAGYAADIPLLKMNWKSPPADLN
jgi:hypothetical protein